MNPYHVHHYGYVEMHKKLQASYRLQDSMFRNCASVKLNRTSGPEFGRNAVGEASKISSPAGRRADVCVFSGAIWPPSGPEA